VDLTTALTLVAAFGGLAGISGLVKVILDGKHTAKQTDLSAQQIQINNLCQTIDEVQDENQRLRQALKQEQTESRQFKESYGNEIDTWRERYYQHQCNIEDMKREMARKDAENEKKIRDLKAEYEQKIHDLEKEYQRQVAIMRRELQKSQKHTAEVIRENEYLREEITKLVGGEPEEDA